MQTAESTQIPVGQSFDCAMAEQTTRRITRELGFAGQPSEEIVLAVAELASNLVRHAGRGALTLRPLHSGDRVGIEVAAADHGPGMRDIEQAFEDGYTTAGGLGYGLGTVNRLMDEIEISSAQRWARGFCVGVGCVRDLVRQYFTPGRLVSRLGHAAMP